jgi:hypothetical protein
MRQHSEERNSSERVIDRASIVVSRQAGCSLDHALTLMQDTARATDEALHEIARDVLAHRVSFGSPP